MVKYKGMTSRKLKLVPYIYGRIFGFYISNGFSFGEMMLDSNYVCYNFVLLKAHAFFN
jgi:hypothetical protein